MIQIILNVFRREPLAPEQLAALEALYDRRELSLRESGRQGDLLHRSESL